MKLLKFILSLETFFCSSCFLAIFSPENQKREWDKTKNWKFLVRSPTPARVLKQLSSCLRLQMKKTKFSPKVLFRAWTANEEPNHLLRYSFITKSDRSWDTFCPTSFNYLFHLKTLPQPDRWLDLCWQIFAHIPSSHYSQSRSRANPTKRHLVSCRIEKNLPSYIQRDHDYLFWNESHHVLVKFA